MCAHNYEDLRRHVGHTIECVGWGGIESPVVIDGETVGYDRHYVNVAIECEDCGEVLLNFGRPALEVVSDAVKRAILSADDAPDAWDKVKKILNDTED